MAKNGTGVSIERPGSYQAEQLPSIQVFNLRGPDHEKVTVTGAPDGWPCDPEGWGNCWGKTHATPFSV